MCVKQREVAQITKEVFADKWQGLTPSTTRKVNRDQRYTENKHSVAKGRFKTRYSIRYSAKKTAEDVFAVRKKSHKHSRADAVVNLPT